IRRRRNRIARFVDTDRIIDAGEVGVGVFLRELREVVRKDEPDADDEIHAFGREQPEAGLAIRAVARLDESHVSTQLPVRALTAKVRAVVERLVAAAAEIE